MPRLANPLLLTQAQVEVEVRNRARRTEDAALALAIAQGLTTEDAVGVWYFGRPTVDDAQATVDALSIVESSTSGGGYRYWQQGDGLAALWEVIVYGGRLNVR
jgi:hypothetical protein